MIVLDTSVLIDSFCGPRSSEARLRWLMASGERILLPAVVLYEWLRGPRIERELIEQENVLPSGEAISFGHAEAAVAAHIYRSVKSPRSREIDLAIAATAISRDASLWTLNPRDFKDVPGLRLV